MKLIGILLRDELCTLPGCGLEGYFRNDVARRLNEVEVAFSTETSIIPENVLIASSSIREIGGVFLVVSSIERRLHSIKLIQACPLNPE